MDTRTAMLAANSGISANSIFVGYFWIWRFFDVLRNDDQIPNDAFAWLLPLLFSVSDSFVFSDNIVVPAVSDSCWEVDDPTQCAAHYAREIKMLQAEGALDVFFRDEDLPVDNATERRCEIERQRACQVHHDGAWFVCDESAKRLDGASFRHLMYNDGAAAYATIMGSGYRPCVLDYGPETQVDSFSNREQQSAASTLLHDAYRRMTGALRGDWDKLEAFGRAHRVFVPPVSAAIVNRIDAPRQYLEELLNQRSKAQRLREAFRSYAEVLKDERVTMKQSLRALRDINSISSELSKSAVESDSLWIVEWKDVLTALPSQLCALASGTFDSKGILELLLQKPLQAIEFLVRRRRLTYLFQLRRNSYGQPAAHMAIQRLWNRSLSQNVVDRMLSISDGLTAHFLDRGVQKSGSA